MPEGVTEWMGGASLCRAFQTANIVPAGSDSCAPASVLLLQRKRRTSNSNVDMNNSKLLGSTMPRYSRLVFPAEDDPDDCGTELRFGRADGSVRPICTSGTDSYTLHMSVLH